MKTLAWLPCSVEMVGSKRIDENIVHATVLVTQPGGAPVLLIVPLTLREGDDELIFMAAVSHLQACFKVPPPMPSCAAKEGTDELKSSA